MSNIDTHRIQEDELRRKTIGGSCALKIMNGDWHELWMQKMGYGERVDLSDVLPVQLGVFTEAFNVQWFEKLMQVECKRDAQGDTESRYHFMWHGVPCRGTMDAEFEYQGKRIGLECKHTNERANMNSQLERYMPQLQMYMQCAALEHMYFANIFGNSRYEYVKVAKNEYYLSEMHTQLKEFWNYVTTETEPPLSMPYFNATIDQIEIDNMTSRNMNTDNEFMDRAHKYIETQQAAKQHAAVGKDLKSMVATNEREIYSDVLNIKRDKRGSLRINVKK
jgi:hypothetical protein